MKPLLRGRFGRAYRYAEVTPSTQRMLAADEAEGAVAVAEEQTAGRGRLGRSWQAPAGTSVLVSVLLLPDVEPAKLPELSLVAGNAVAEAIVEVTGIEPTIKFPNDVLIGGRKVAGILAESSDGRVVLNYGALGAGHTHVSWIYFQVNPTNVGKRQENLDVKDGETELVRIKRSMTIFP